MKAYELYFPVAICLFSRPATGSAEQLFWHPLSRRLCMTTESSQQLDERTVKTDPLEVAIGDLRRAIRQAEHDRLIHLSKRSARVLLQTLCELRDKEKKP